jgi:HlyD family secretion protein
LKELDLGKLRVDRSGATPKATAKSQPLWRDKRYWWAAAAIVVVAFFLLKPSVAKVQTTQVVSAWPSQEFVQLNSTGYVIAKRKAAVAPKGTGRVEWVGVNEGDHVTAGQVLAKLESSDVAANYQAAVANTAVASASLVNAQGEFDDAKLNLERANKLYAKHLVAKLYLQDAKSRYARADANTASAKAGVEAARANQTFARSSVDYAQIKAPFDGVVISRSADVGDIVTPLASAADAKGAVLVVADMSAMEVNAEVSESSLSSIRVGQPCEIVLDAFADKRYRGEVAVIVPTVNRASATVTVKVRILDVDTSILPDMSARVSFLSQPADAQQQAVLAVNPQAIVTDGSESVVYALSEGDRVRAVPVKAGALLGGVRAVSGDLKAGDTIVLDPGSRLKDGSRIKRSDAS